MEPVRVLTLLTVMTDSWGLDLARRGEDGMEQRVERGEVGERGGGLNALSEYGWTSMRCFRSLSMTAGGGIGSATATATLILISSRRGAVGVVVGVQGVVRPQE